MLRLIKNLSLSEKVILIISVVFLNILIFYYLSPYSIYYFHPTLKFLIRLFYFTFFILPKDFYIPCGGILTICLPNPLTISLSYIISLIFQILIISLFLKLIRSFNKKLLVLLITIIFFPLVGGVFEQEVCINKYRTEKNSDGSKFVEKNGVIGFVFADKPSMEKAKIFYKVNGLQYASGDISTSAIYVKVPVGQEFIKICQIKSYRQIYSGSEPVSIFTLKNPSGSIINHWIYMDRNFCSTNQLDPIFCTEMLKRYAANY